MEYAAEKEAYRQQTEQMGLQRKVKRGDAWWPVKMGKSYYNSLNQLVVEVHRQGDDEEIEHNFEFGKPVVFFRIDGKDQIKYFNFTATVNYVDGDRMISSSTRPVIRLCSRPLIASSAPRDDWVTCGTSFTRPA